VRAAMGSGKSNHKINNINLTTITELIQDYIANTAPITINVAPNTIKIMTSDGYYRSTFETSTKGESYLQQRKIHENKCFLGLYDLKTVTNFDRPKYGALNFLNNPAGIPSAQGYGAFHLTVASPVRKRCTITPMDSFGFTVMGVLDYCDHVWMHLGPKELKALVRLVMGKIESSDQYGSIYREIQIHGDMKCDRDFLTLSVPRGTDPTNLDIAVAFTEKFGIKLVKY
jgi:hypothetical protein